MTRIYQLNQNHQITFTQTERTDSPLYREALASCFVIAAFFGSLLFAYIAF